MPDPRAHESYEAGSVVARDYAEQIEIQLGHLCNNRCLFCVSGQLTEMGLTKQIPLEPVSAILEAAAARGVRRVTFDGGEPTIQDSFLAVLRRTVELGFDDVVIFTNGVRSGEASFVDEVVKIGRFTWRFSIQGGNEEAHDRVTMRPGSFQRILDGLTHLSALGQPITANMCVTEQSYRSLPDYAALVERFRIRELHIDMLRPSDAGMRDDAYLRSIMPRYSDMAPFVDSLLAKIDRYDPAFNINIGNYPFCQLPQWSHRIHHGGELTFTHTTNEQAQLGAVWNKYDYQRSDKIYAAQCDVCVFKPHCRGVPEKYAQFYGTDELRPVTREILRAAGAEDHLFAKDADRWLAALRPVDPPPSWRLLEAYRSTADRRVELRYKHLRGDVWVMVTPAGDNETIRAPRPLLQTNAFSIGVVPKGPSDIEGMVRLVSAIADELSRGTEFRVTARMTADAIRSMFQPMMIEHRRDRLAGIAERLASREWRGWNVSPADWSPDRLAASFRIRHAEEPLEIGVFLSADFENLRRPVAVSFDVPESDEARVRDVVRQVAASLDA